MIALQRIGGATIEGSVVREQNLNRHTWYACDEIGKNYTVLYTVTKNVFIGYEYIDATSLKENAWTNAPLTITRNSIKISNKNKRKT